MSPRPTGKILKSIELPGCLCKIRGLFRTKSPERKPVNHDALASHQGVFLLQLIQPLAFPQVRLEVAGVE